MVAAAVGELRDTIWYAPLETWEEDANETGATKGKTNSVR